MFGFGKKNKEGESSAVDGKANAEMPDGVESGSEKEIKDDSPQSGVDALEKSAEGSFFSKVKKGLGKTREGFASGLGDILLGRKEIDDEMLEELETQLIIADVGVEATRKVIQSITEQVARKELLYADALYLKLKQELLSIVTKHERGGEQSALAEINSECKPYVIMVVGVNGVGKTTTIGKLAKRFQKQGKQVMLAAGDTFRAAAVEQLQVWGERNDVPVVAQHTGADSASVIFDALQSAQSKGVDVLIADTAGRLHNKSNLMDELSKVKRVLAKLDGSAPHEVMLAIDAGTGQNALNQVKQFDEAVGLSSLVLTKLDGTAKGGVVFAIADQCDIPIKYIGVGEQIDDLQPFDPESFVDAIFLDD